MWNLLLCSFCGILFWVKDFSNTWMSLSTIKMKKFAKTKSLYLFINQFEWVNHLSFDIFACVYTHIYSNDIYFSIAKRIIVLLSERKNLHSNNLNSSVHINLNKSMCRSWHGFEIISFQIIVFWQQFESLVIYVWRFIFIHS